MAQLFYRGPVPTPRISLPIDTPALSILITRPPTFQALPVLSVGLVLILIEMGRPLLV